jgi:hypothetical protein
MLSVRYIRIGASGDTLTAVARMTSVNEGGGVPDSRHSITAGPEDWQSVDVSYRRSFGADSVEAGIGVERRDQAWLDDEDVLGRAWLSWRRSFR